MARLRPGKLPIRGNDRAAFIGATGTGKTTLAKGCLWGIKHAAVLDPKRTFVLPAAWPHGWKLTESRKEVEGWHDPATLVYRPTADETEDPDAIQWWFRWLMERGNTTAYVDETYMITDSTAPGKWHNRVLTAGRELGIGIWHATQRPVRIPLVCLSEAEHMFVFRLRHPADRERVADYGDPAMLARNPAGNQFWYWSDPQQELRWFDRADVKKVLT